MAAYTTGTAVGPGAGDAFFQALRTHMGSNGWTEYDVITDIVGSRDIVFRSSALDSSADNRCYVRVTMATNNYSQRMYVDWDPVTHVGSRVAGTGTTTTTSDSSFTYWIRANGVSVGHCVKISATYYKSYFGFVRRTMPPARRGMTKTTSTYAAGTTTMNVASDLTTSLQAGQAVVIYNHGHNSASANYNNGEILEVLSVASGSITFKNATSYAYDSGAVIGWNAFPGIQVQMNNAEVGFGTSMLACMAHSGYYQAATVHTASGDLVLFASEGNTDPSDISLEYVPGLICSTMNSAAWGYGFHGILYHWEGAASSAQVKEDTMTDGVYSFVVLGVQTTGVMMLGPT